MGSGEGVSEAGREERRAGKQEEKNKDSQREAMLAGHWWSGPECLNRSWNSKVCVTKLELSSLS